MYDVNVNDKGFSADKELHVSCAVSANCGSFREDCVRGDGFMTSQDVKHWVRRLMSLANVTASHNLGCILGCSIKCLANLFKGYIEQEWLIFPVVPAFGNQLGWVGLGLNIRVGYNISFIESWGKIDFAVEIKLIIR